MAPSRARFCERTVLRCNTFLVAFTHGNWSRDDVMLSVANMLRSRDICCPRNCSRSHYMSVTRRCGLSPYQPCYVVSCWSQGKNVFNTQPTSCGRKSIFPTCVRPLVHAMSCHLSRCLAARDAAAFAHTRQIIIAPCPHALVIGLEPSPHSSHTRVEPSHELSEARLSPSHRSISKHSSHTRTKPTCLRVRRDLASTPSQPLRPRTYAHAMIHLSHQSDLGKKTQPPEHLCTYHNCRHALFRP